EVFANSEVARPGVRTQCERTEATIARASDRSREGVSPAAVRDCDSVQKGQGLRDRVFRVSLDLLVFGPHPDDIEIGLGATVALHVALGHEVGLCDLTLGEMGSNGTVEDRRREAADAAKVLGVAWRQNLEWPDGGIPRAPEFVRSGVDLLRVHRPRTIAIPYWKDRHPDHVAASEVSTLAAFKSGLRRYEKRGEPWRPRGGV